MASAVARALQVDPEFYFRKRPFFYMCYDSSTQTLGLIDTTYIDMSAHAEARVPQIKAFFSYLVERATWHRPSLLVLDNLDKLLSAEVEVSTLWGWTSMKLI